MILAFPAFRSMDVPRGRSRDGDCAGCGRPLAVHFDRRNRFRSCVDLQRSLEFARRLEQGETFVFDRHHGAGDEGPRVA